MMAVAADIKERARGRWPEILHTLDICVPAKATQHGPCPACGGTDRFRFDDKDGHGSWLCNQCDPQAGNGFHLVRNVKQCSMDQAVEMVVGALRVEPCRGPIRCFKWEDREGRIAYHLRWPREKSKFTWSLDRDRQRSGKGDCDPLLYLLSQVDAAEVVIVTEGERDADTINNFLREVGLDGTMVATCTPAGADAVKGKYLEPIYAKKTVFLSGDNDEAGVRYVQKCLTVLNGRVNDLRHLKVPSGNDWTDWHGTAEKFKELLDSAESIKPASHDRLALVSAASIKPIRVEYLVGGIIPKAAVSVVAGDPGQGKTTLTLEWAAKVSVGQLDGGTPGDVLIVSAEDSPAHTLVPRLIAANACLSRCHFVPGGVTLPDDLPRLERVIEEVAAKLLIIDPLSAHLPASVNSWKDSDIRRVMAPLAEVADRHGIAVVIVAHLNKGGRAGVLARVGGSMGLVAAARSVLLAANDPDSSDHILFHVKSNVGPHARPMRYRTESRIIVHQSEPIETASIVWLGEANGVSADKALNGDDRSERSALAEANEFLRDALDSGPVHFTQLAKLAKQAGIADVTLRRAKIDLRVISKRIGFGQSGQYVWELPVEKVTLA